MSSDNFWYVKGNAVYMGDASDFASFMDDAEERFRHQLANRHPYHEAESHEAARAWAHNEYAEYGIYWIEP